jgi:hypothetical protein
VLTLRHTDLPGSAIDDHHNGWNRWLPILRDTVAEQTH